MSNLTLWKHCINYLFRCNVLNDKHVLFLENASLIDLVNLIKDGVLICILNYNLDENSIDIKQVCMNPHNSRFLCIKNINLFLNSCKFYFKLNKDDLFEPDMLFECTDFGKVIHTLSVLSHSSFIKKEIKGFPEIGDGYDNNDDDDNKKLYKNLEKLNLKKHEDNQHLNKLEVKIYEDLRNVSNLNQLQTDLPICELIPCEKREHNIKELVDTERSFIHLMNIIIKNFMNPLKCVMRSADHECIFFKFKNLLEIHKGFYYDLYNGIMASNLNQIFLSKIFEKWSESFLVYCKYCSNLEKARYLLLELSKKESFFHEKLNFYQEQTNGGKYKLVDLISFPIQRVLKYHIIIKEILKNTHMKHLDYINLKRTYLIMQDLNNCLNEAKRDCEMLNTISAIESSITDLVMPSNTQLKDYGRLIKDGEIRVRFKDVNEIKNRYVFVFDKVIIMCKTVRNTQYSFKEALDLKNFQLHDLREYNYQYQEEQHHSFYLMNYIKNYIYTFYAKNKEIKEKWIEAINKALDNICPKYVGDKLTNHKFVMCTFDEIVKCSYCDLWLKGFYYQGYKCLVCSLQVHKECISLINNGCFKCKELIGNKTVVGKKEKEKNLEFYDWFGGLMEREIAEHILMDKYLEDGTFLVRISVKKLDAFAISLKHKNSIKHIKIMRNLNNKKYYLSESEYFDSLVDLIEWYEVNSLCNSFDNLNTTLKVPFKKNCGANSTKTNDEKNLVQALYSFTSDSLCLLSFHKGDVIKILSKTGEKKGCWKGELKGRIGYFPFEYVEKIF